MKPFAKIVNVFQPLNIFAKSSVFRWQDSEYASVLLRPQENLGKLVFAIPNKKN